MNSITNIKTQDSVLNNTKNILSDCVLISKAYVKKQEEFKTLYDMVKYLTQNLLRNNSTNIHNLQLAFNTINDYRGKLLQYIKIIDQKEETIKNTSLEQFRQEFECEFLGSTNTLISGEKLQQLAYMDAIYEH